MPTPRGQQPQVPRLVRVQHGRPAPGLEIAPERQQVASAARETHRQVVEHGKGGRQGTVETRVEQQGIPALGRVVGRETQAREPDGAVGMGGGQQAQPGCITQGCDQPADPVALQVELAIADQLAPGIGLGVDHQAGPVDRIGRVGDPVVVAVAGEVIDLERELHLRPGGLSGLQQWARLEPQLTQQAHAQGDHPRWYPGPRQSRAFRLPRKNRRRFTRRIRPLHAAHGA
jgi:hypothetical protein